MAGDTGYTNYNIDFAIYSEAAWVTSQCAEITFYNNGTSNAFVKGLKVVPGLMIAINGNEGEMDTTTYYISFDNTAVNSLVVLRKLYNDFEG